MRFSISIAVLTLLSPIAAQINRFHSSRQFAAKIDGGSYNAKQLASRYGFEIIHESTLFGESGYYLLQERGKRYTKQKSGTSYVPRYRRHYGSSFRKSKSGRGQTRSKRQPLRILKNNNVKSFAYQRPLSRTKRDFQDSDHAKITTRQKSNTQNTKTTKNTQNTQTSSSSSPVHPATNKFGDHIQTNMSNPLNPYIESKPYYNFSDSEWSRMWYLQARENAGNMRVEDAWQAGYTGKGSVVTILDDGLERDHPDLASNFNWLASKDINDQDDDPMPRYTRANENKHGTRCAGIVAAQQNNKNCIVGIAHGATIGGVKMLDGEVNDMVEAEALGHGLDYVHIYSASWGPDDNGKTVDGPRALTAKAFKYGTDYGRNGLGSIFIWASGNGGSAYDSCSCDGYTNSIYTISVSSANNEGDEPWYSEHCASTLTTAYSSGDSRDGRVHTTDLRWRCTDSHTGTSASAPMVAAISALALEANPRLSWRDLQHIIVRTSRHEHLKANDWHQNGAGHWFSHIFGYGLIDALGVVKVAEVWKSVPPQIEFETDRDDQFYPISNKAPAEIKYTVLRNMTSIDFLEHLQLTVSITSPRRGDLSVELISPVGTKSTMLPQRATDKTYKGFNDWTFMSVHFWGENPLGTWTLRVIDMAPIDATGNSRRKVNTIKSRQTYSRNTEKKLTSWRITFRGTQYDPQENFDAQAMEEAIGSAPRAQFKVDTVLDTLPENPNQKVSILTNRNNQCNAEREQEFTYDGCSGLCDNGFGCCGSRASDCFRCESAVSNDKETCLKNCPAEMYPHGDLKVCHLCRPECKTCSVNAANCTSCYPFSRLEVNSETQLGSCESTCKQSGYYIDRGGNCKLCHNTCARCSGPGRDQCMKCTLARFYNSGQCIENCPEGWYGNTDTNSCMKCHDNCETCYGKSEHQCVECAEGLIMVDGTCEFQCVDRINPSLCHNLHEFCDVKLVYRSCCASCTSLTSGGALPAKTSTDSVQDATASETDPSAPGIAGRKQDTGKVDPSAPGSNKRKTTKKLLSKTKSKYSARSNKTKTVSRSALRRKATLRKIRRSRRRKYRRTRNLGQELVFE